jgi:rod shape-determining protein MreD
VFLNKIPLWFPLSLAVFFSIFGSIFIPDVRLMAFAPFLAISFQRLSLIKSLWLSLACGLSIDIISSQLHFGLYSVCYLLTSALCYHQKKHFFEEKPIALSLYTALISASSSLILLVLSALFDKQLYFSLELILSECLVTPVLDAAYAFAWFTIPFAIYLFILSGKWKKYFEKNEEPS